MVDGGGVGAHLLGAHVVGCADELAGLGQAGHREKVGAGGARHAEVEHFRLSGFLHKDVGRLQVAVDDPLIVRVLHRVAHPRHETHAGSEVEAAAAGKLVQRQPVDKLHREIRLAVVGEAGLVDLRDARVMQPAQDLGLVGEPLDDGGRGEAAADDLEGHSAAWAILLRLVDGAHAALANDLQHLVMPQPAERVRPSGRGQEVERDVGFGPHSARQGRHPKSHDRPACPTPPRAVLPPACPGNRPPSHATEAAPRCAAASSDRQRRRLPGKAARSAGSSFSIASKKIARSPIALHSTIVVAGDVACGASFLTMPPVGHRLPMRNRRRNHAILLQNRCAFYPPPSRAWCNQARA